jgi:hypothetical protein
VASANKHALHGVKALTNARDAATAAGRALVCGALLDCSRESDAPLTWCKGPGHTRHIEVVIGVHGIKRSRTGRATRNHLLTRASMERTTGFERATLTLAT